jgi:hypothetical protein
MASAEVEEVVASYSEVISGAAIAPPAIEGEDDDSTSESTEEQTK